VALSAVNTAGNQITATFTLPRDRRASTRRRRILERHRADGDGERSTGTLLKLYGDINSDGSMVYVDMLRHGEPPALSERQRRGMRRPSPRSRTA
jgi:hypothetical protein